MNPQPTTFPIPTILIYPFNRSLVDRICLAAGAARKERYVQTRDQTVPIFRGPMVHFRVGISGWTYDGWRGVFYPTGLAQKRQLEFASHCFNTVEINGTFYSLQRPHTFRRWYDETPANFRFAVKGSRYITHMKKLKSVQAPLANFFASGVLALREKLGPILWQFPPQLGFSEELFASFLELLPATTTDAAKLAKKHDQRVSGRAYLRTDRHRRIRHAVEIRHESFMDPAFFKLLRKYKVAFVIADSAGTFPYAEETTADFVYVRLHGSSQLYTSGYTDEELKDWARRIRGWRRDVYVYFDNDRKVKAPFDALRLAERLGLKTEYEPFRKAA